MEAEGGWAGEGIEQKGKNEKELIGTDNSVVTAAGRGGKRWTRGGRINGDGKIKLKNKFKNNKKATFE